MTIRSTAWLAFVGSIISVGACGSDDDARGSQELRLPQPSLSIGVENDSLYQFHRIAGGRRLSDGRIVVLNAGSGQLRFYDSLGRYVSHTGTRGQGPGEFNNPTGLCRLAGDSLLVTEQDARIASNVFDAQGSYRRSLSLIEPPGLVHECNENGQLLIAVGLPPFRPRSGTWRDSTTFLVFDSRRQTVDTLGRFPIQELFETSVAGRSGRADIPFGRSLVTGLGADEAYIGTQDAYEIRAIGLTGKSLRTITRSWTPLPVTRDWIRQHEENLEAVRARAAEMRGESRPGNTAPVPYPDAMPPYSMFRVASTGSLWVRDYHPSAAVGQVAGMDSTVAWSIFDRGGRVVGRLRAPLSLAILDIGSDHILGRWRNEDGVESIRLYRLRLP